MTAAPRREAAERPGVPAALSSDELRALARVAGAVLPPELLDGWHRDDVAVADTVAVRSLLARGLLQLRPGEVALTRATRGGLDPLLDARALAGLHLLGRDGQERRQVVAESTAGTLLLTEREPDVWTLDPIPGPAERAAAWLAADLLEDGMRPAPTGVAFTVPAGTLRQVDQLITAGRCADAATELTGIAAPDAPVDRWAAVRRSREASGEVRLTRRLAAGVFAGGTVGWLDAGTAGVWLVEPDEPPGDDVEDTAEPAVRFTDAGVTGVRAALAALLEEDPQ